MNIEVYLDGQDMPFTVIQPPDTFKLDTTKLADGPHSLLFKAIAADGSTSVRETRFVVRNGPGIAVHGIRDNDVIAGEIDVLANAYSSRVGDVFEPMRIETPAPIPTWAWLIFLVVLAWGMWYLGIEYKEHQSQTIARAPVSSDSVTEAPDIAVQQLSNAWRALGRQVYENNCSSCHQLSGTGLPGLFPPLNVNAVVTADDATDHILTIVNGLQNKIIDGVTYPAPMPPFGAILSDEEIAAVVNHERTSWGHNASLVTPEQVGGFHK